MPNPKVTLEDIAIRVGVSTAAVSQALSGKGALSQATRERILQVVEELAYHPDEAAQNLARRYASQASGKRLGRSKSKQLPPPEIMVFYNITELVEVIQLEIQQRDEEGYEVCGFQDEINSWHTPAKKNIYRLYSEILSAPLRPDFPYQEPETLADIQSARPAGPRDARLPVSTSQLFEKIYGAWLGRTAGCVLGKPLQGGWSKGQVIQYLQIADSYPLRNYVPRLVPPPAGFVFKAEAAGAFLGEIHGARPDDDTDFTLLALYLVETYGLGFTKENVATEWLNHLPYFGTFTTDRAIYRNLVWNIHPDEAAGFVNPEREYIGARIRSDLYGYIAPGKPELAASLAYKDASLSHTKNGVYSAMLTAAMISWAFVTNDIYEIIEVGLSEIPAHCRLAEAVREATAAYQDSADWELAYEHLLLKYGHYSPIHAIQNTVWAILGLCASQGDFDQGFSSVVTCGMDTGSNAANLGSILGTMAGATQIPAHWIQPLEDTLHNAIAQFPETHISELARRTARLAEKSLSLQS